jgi:hypothetical protein
VANQLENLLRLNRTPEMPRGSNRLAGVVEPAMTVGSNILAEIPAYAAGMTELNQTGLPSEGFSRLEEVSEMLTYNPRTMEGQAGLQSLTNGVMKVMDTLGVDEAINYLNNTIVPNLQRTFGEEGAREIGSSVMMSIPFVRKVPSMKAFHGSPHDFDEFSLDAIGTGEGAQAYGHGLYFADSEDVARGYRDQLKGNIVIRDDGVQMAYGDHVTEIETAIKEKFPNLASDNVRTTARSVVNDNLVPDDVQGMGAFDKTGYRAEDIYLEGIRANKGAKASKGSMYEVDIDASPDELLDYDVPLTEQSELVRNVLKDYDYKTTPEQVSAYDNALLKTLHGTEEELFAPLPKEPRNPKGSVIYRDIQGVERMPPFDSSSIFDGAPEASAALAKKGIKGIRYKDGFSRGADGGTSNYVIFDDRLISIAKKYGIAIPAAAALLSQETGLNPNSLYEEDNPV